MSLAQFHHLQRIIIVIFSSDNNGKLSFFSTPISPTVFLAFFILLITGIVLQCTSHDSDHKTAAYISLSELKVSPNLLSLEVKILNLPTWICSVH